MTTSYFTYERGKVIQALRFHFISRKEIKFMIILVNVFAVTSAALFYLRKIHPLSFLISSMLWFVLMIVYWYWLPRMIYKRSATFQDRLRVKMDEEGVEIENERGSQRWPWTAFSATMETPHFFHLYFNPRSFFIVPKDAFNGDDVHEARKLMKRVGG
jgi:predicted membrane protein